MRYLYSIIHFNLIGVCFFIAESISNVAGLGFYYDEEDKPKWDLVKTIDVLKFEAGVNCKEQSNAWNVCTQKWLRRYRDS